MLYEQGVHPNDIAVQAGVQRRQVERYVKGLERTRQNCQRIPFELSAPKIQDLMLVGWPTKAIAAKLGYAPATITKYKQVLRDQALVRLGILHV